MSDKTILLATNLQQSVLTTLDANKAAHIAHAPYGHRPHGSGILSLIGFNGQMPDPITGHYHLGNGYRQYNPILMRFNSPDSWSPFGPGGLNTYGYCAGEPITRTDPSGHLFSRYMFGRSRSQRQENFLNREMTFLKDRVSVIGERPALDPLTEVSFKATMERLDGVRKIKKAARRQGMRPEDYVTQEMLEMRPVELSPIPDRSILSQLSADANHALAHDAVERIAKLENNIRVLDDLIDGARPKTVTLAAQRWIDTHKSIRNERNIIGALRQTIPPSSNQETRRIRS